MFSIYQNIKNTLLSTYPQIKYIDWERGQLEEANCFIEPPAILINISTEWEGNQALATINLKIWIMHYEDAYAIEKPGETAAFALSSNILSSLDKIQGERFNTLQRKQEQLMPNFNGLILEATYYCNLKKAQL